MQTTQATICKKLLLLSWVLLLILQPATSAEISAAAAAGAGAGVDGASGESISCLVCRLIPGLTPSQQSMCCDIPTAINILDTAKHSMRTECRWQLRKELWNCSDIGMPIFKPPNMQETPEKAFIYALSSATTVHRITSACSAGELGSECGCDYSRNGLMTVQGWQWGSCSDNISYGVSFAQNFLDNRELDVDVRNSTAVAHTAVHLHNNAVGRRVVSENMMLSCRCHGLSGSCAVRTCWRELPTYFQIGDILKTKFDNALEVAVTTNRNEPPLLTYYDEYLAAHIQLGPSDSSLVYLENNQNYCYDGQNFTQDRRCLPQTFLDAQNRGQVKVSSSREYFPPCEEFCCSGEYYEETTSHEENCNCRFVWCCNVECQKCTVNATQYRCTG